MTGPLYLDFEALHRLFHPSTPPPEFDSDDDYFLADPTGGGTWIKRGDDPVIDPDIHHDDPIDREVTA